ncbi:HNH endonuclease [Blastococcus sp. KM273128]|nr:HNH endonuclease [Blastococcus sp. KM273128]
MDAVEHDLSDQQWAALEHAWGGCAYCGATGRPLQRDCVLPISHSGRHDSGGPVPGPALSLRRAGRTGTFLAWLRRKRLDERAFLVRQAQIRASLALLFDPEPAGATD